MIKTYKNLFLALNFIIKILNMLNILNIEDKNNKNENIKNEEDENILKNISHLPNEILFTLGTYIDSNEMGKLSKINDRLKEHFELPFYNERRLLKCNEFGYTFENNKNLILGYKLKVSYYNNSSVISSINDVSSLVSYETAFQKLSNFDVPLCFWLPIMINSNSLKNINFKKLLMDQIIFIAVSTKSIRNILYKNTFDNPNFMNNPWNIKNILNEVNEANEGKVKYIFSFENRLEYLKSKMINPEFYYEEFIVNILSHLMFSIVYNMYSNDTFMFEDMLDKYCQIHKLFYCLSKEYPEIENIVNLKIKNFIQKIKNRHISNLPYLYMIFIYLSISKIYHIDDVIELIIEENYKRNFKLIIDKTDYTNDDLNSNFLFYKNNLGRIWNIVNCNHKMIIFHCHLLNNISRIKNKSLDDIMKSYDYYYGHVPRDVKENLKEKCLQIFKINSFKEYYEKLGLHYHGDVFLSHQLFRAFEIANKIKYIVLINGIYTNNFYNINSNNTKYEYLPQIIL